MAHEVQLFDNAGNRKYLNAAERKQFYEVAKTLSDFRKRAFALTLYFTGCRISEALNLSIERVDLSDGRIVFETLKQRHHQRFRSVPIPDELIELLEKMTNQTNCEKTSYIWDFSRTTGWQIIKDCMKMANLDEIKATPKGLRHSFAIACLSAGVPLTTVQKFLGHSQLKTTAIYVDFSSNDERMWAERLWNSSA